MIEAVARTHPGQRRTSNEDACFADTRLGLFAVADGMGGHKAGEVASQVGLDAVVDFVRQSREDHAITWPYGLDRDRSFESNQLKNAVQIANQSVYRAARARPEWQGMGAALVVALCRGPNVAYTSVGDSRLYLFRDGRLEQLSLDQSWGASMLRAGADPEAVRKDPMRHMLTSALGVEAALRPRIDDTVLEHGDVLLLCSDGVHGLLDDEDIRRILAAGGAALDTCANALIDAANAAGGTDNLTVLLVRHANDDGGGQVRR